MWAGLTGRVFQLGVRGKDGVALPGLGGTVWGFFVVLDSGLDTIAAATYVWGALAGGGLVMGMQSYALVLGLGWAK